MSSGPGFVIADMSTVIMHNVVSVDGFIADANDQVGPLFDWYVNGDVEIIDGGEFRVSQASADYVKTMWAGIGSMVIGRHVPRNDRDLSWLHGEASFMRRHALRRRPRVMAGARTQTGPDRGAVTGPRCEAGAVTGLWVAVVLAALGGVALTIVTRDDLAATWPLTWATRRGPRPMPRSVH
jgi:hypothetical protein